MKCPICQNEMIKYTPGISEFYSCPKCEYSTPMVRTPIFFYLVSQSDKLMQENKCPFPLTPCYLRKEHGECTADPKDDSAPNINDRIHSVFYTIQAGFKTSVSCEPLLDPDCKIVEFLLEKVPEVAIWIGAMNYVKNAPKLDYQAIFAKYKDNSHIRWKESFRKHLPASLQEEIKSKWWYTEQLPLF